MRRYGIRALAGPRFRPCTTDSRHDLPIALGFALTVVSIRLTPVLASAIGWRWRFLMLVPGPIVGVVAMVALRRLPEARKIAHGLR